MGLLALPSIDGVPNGEVPQYAPPNTGQTAQPSGGLLGNFMDGRQEASNNLNNWMNEALDGLLGPSGIQDRLRLANLFLNPAINADQASRHTRTALDPSVRGADRALAVGQGLLEIFGLVAPAIASRLTPRLPGQNLGDEAIRATTETFANMSSRPEAVALNDFTTSDFGGVNTPLYGGYKVGDLPQRAQDNVNSAIDQFPDLETFLRNVMPEEAVGVTPRNAQSVMDYFKAVDQDALQAAAIAGDAKRGWYKHSAATIQEVFGEDSPRFTALLSALSPQTSVESNLRNATHTWANWVRAGRPKDPDAIIEIMGRSVEGDKGVESVLDGWKNNSIRALTAPQSNLPDVVPSLSGPKVDSFGRNTFGDLNPVTMDTHASDLLGRNQSDYSQKGTPAMREMNVPGFGPAYIGDAAAHRSVAGRMSDEYGMQIDPANVQETSWSFAKPMKDLYKSSGGRSMQDLYDSGELTDELVSGTPDFATLLRDPSYSNPLKEAGYDLGKITQPEPVGLLGATPDPVALRRSIGNLQDAVDRTRAITATQPFRAGFGDPKRSGYQRGGPTSLSLGTGDVGGVRLKPNPEFAQAASRTGIDTPEMILANRASAPAVANQAATYHAAYPDWLRGMVDLPDEKAYRSGKAIVTDGATALVKKDGEISGLIKAKGGPKGFAQTALHAATENGGTWLNAYDTALPQMYSRAGFRPVARLKFNKEFAPDSWDYTRLKDTIGTGEPDVVFMVYDPKFTGKVTRGVGGKTFEDYDEAVAFTKTQAEKLKGKK